MILSKPKRSAATTWLERVNPLQGLTITQAKNIFDVARAHGSPLLQKIYEEIELTDPVLMTCVERRQSALAGLGWRAVANASAADDAKAEDQRRALEAFANGIENLDEAIEHLDLAFFRGYSVCQPIWEGIRVRRVNLLNSWNFLRGDDDRLMWNPECTLDPKGCEEITPAARIVQLNRRRAIDWPALSIYIRKYVGERDWGRFLERYGIPPVDVIMAPNATDEQRGEYLACAEAAKNGSSVAYPSGTSISRAETSRGQDPFTAFIEHQEKLIVLMATGGTLTSLAQADTGSLAGGAQMDVWEQIVQRDGVVISAAMNRDLFIPFLREAFPGEPVMAHFEIGKEDEPSATEAADLAGKLKVAGWRVDQSQLEEQTGLKLEREESASQPMPFGAARKVVLGAAVTDANGLSHGEDGRFDGGNGSSHKENYLEKTTREHHDRWKKEWGEINELNDLHARFANSDGAERERLGDEMRRKFKELKDRGIVERNYGENGKAFKHANAPSLEYILRDEEIDRKIRSRPKDPTERLVFAKKNSAAAKHPNADDVNARIAENDNAGLLEAFAADMSPAADAITHLLNNPTKEAAEELIAKIGDLMPDDPAMAAILAEAMANEFVKKEDK